MPNKLGERGILASFADEQSVIAAARTLSESGYRELDAYTPRPLPQLEALIPAPRSTLPRDVLFGGIAGGVTAFVGQAWCNAWDYPLNVGGRPALSIPAAIPITFELTVLFAALTAFFGVMWRMGLPRLVHPVFEAPGFQRASIDRFFLFVSADDPRFHREQTLAQLLSLGCELAQHIPVDEASVRDE